MTLLNKQYCCLFSNFVFYSTFERPSCFEFPLGKGETYIPKGQDRKKTKQQQQKNSKGNSASRYSPNILPKEWMKSYWRRVPTANSTILTLPLCHESPPSPPSPPQVRPALFITTSPPRGSYTTSTQRGGLNIL